MPTTVSPRATRRRMSRGPMKPVAPITSTAMADRLPAEADRAHAGRRVATLCQIRRRRESPGGVRLYPDGLSGARDMRGHAEPAAAPPGPDVGVATPTRAAVRQGVRRPRVDERDVAEDPHEHVARL